MTPEQLRDEVAKSIREGLNRFVGEPNTALLRKTIKKSMTDFWQCVLGPNAQVDVQLEDSGDPRFFTIITKTSISTKIVE